jgi:SAM-dependent methyltransferase
MDTDDWARGTDTNTPTAARMYDYYLNGSHNFAADREAAQRVLQAMPAARRVAMANRAFLARAVRYMIEQGVRQFLDIGSGIPTVGNVHEVAQHVVSDARVVYVDIDAIAVTHGRQLLADNPSATSVFGDLRHPKQILDLPEVRTLLDVTAPLGLLLIAVVPFVSDDTEAADSVRILREALAPGSYLAISHGTHDGFDPAELAAARAIYKTTTTPVSARTRSQVEALFQGLELVDPGLVWLPQWRPEDPDEVPDDPERYGLLAGVGRKVQ